jgi:hypothetical protein
MTIGDQKGYMIGNLTTHNSGTGTVSATTTALSGAGGSAFLTELYAGAVIKAAGQTLAIESVTTDSAAVLQTAPATPISGATFEIYPMLNLSNPNLKIPHPKSNFKQWQSKIDLGNGLARGVGRPSCSWVWGFITAAQYDQLRAYITGASGRIYIRTRTTETADSYKVYLAAALWPDEVNRDATRRVGFTIEMRDMVLL